MESVITITPIIGNKILDKVSEKQFNESYCYYGAQNYGLAPVQWNHTPKPVLLSKGFIPYIDKIRKFDVKSDDIWIVTFPKCGTTWMAELMWLLKNNLNYERAKEIELYTRIPFLELPGITHRQVEDPFEVLSNAELRTIKSHMPVAYLPEQIWNVKPKMIYVARNPKDVAASYYNHFKVLHRYTGTFNEFFDAYVNDLVPYSPFHDHVSEYWKLSKTMDNLLFIWFEDMKRDLETVIKKVAKFLEKNLTDDELLQLKSHLSFDAMKSIGCLHII